MPQSVNDNMIYQFHNVIPGLLLEGGNVFLDLSTIEKVKNFNNYKGELRLKDMHLLPSGMFLKREFIEGLHVLQEELEVSKPNIWGVKGEITGPMTEAYSITVIPKRSKAIHDDEIFDVIVKTTCEVAVWLSSKIAEITRKVVGKDGAAILFVDEPLLPLVLREHDANEVKEALERVLKKIKCKKGVHVCDEPASVADMILELGVDYFSFDMKKYPKTLEIIDRERLKQHIAEGKGFAFGVTPNTPESIMDEGTLYKAYKREVNIEEFLPTPHEIAKTLTSNLEKVKEEVNLEDLVMGSLLTPQCGFRSFTVPNPEEGEKIVRILLERQEKAAQIIREKYGIHKEKA
ncbi:MAG: hypothetical protein QW461_03760 [Candidatus Jordarchaeales archaeon]